MNKLLTNAEFSNELRTIAERVKRTDLRQATHPRRGPARRASSDRRRPERRRAEVLQS